MGRPYAGSARCRAGGRRRLRARIAGMPTKPWGQAAMPFSGSACRTRCLLDVVVVAELVSRIPHSQVNAFPASIVPEPINCPLRRTSPPQVPHPPRGSALTSAPIPTCRPRKLCASPRRPDPSSSAPLTLAPGPSSSAPRRSDSVRQPGSRAPPRTATTQLRSRQIRPGGVSDSESPPPSRYTLASASAPPAALAQSAERLTRNEKVVGSIPTGGSTRTPRSSLKERGRSRGACDRAFCFSAWVGGAEVRRRGQGSGVPRPRVRPASPVRRTSSVIGQETAPSVVP